MYTITMMNIIIAQSVVRSYLARKELYYRKMARAMEGSAIVVQKHARRHLAESKIRSDLARIMLTQSIVRMFLAKKAADRILSRNKLNRSAIVIQSVARRFLAGKVTDLIISRNAFEAAVVVAQSAIRRHNACRLVKRIQRQDRHDAAVKIQSHWRGFWEFSHYVILQYEVSRMQAMVRGKLYRKQFNLRLGCCIMIQASVRRFLVRNQFQSLDISRSLALVHANAMRDSLAVSRKG